jgi:hypothetical protein
VSASLSLIRATLLALLWLAPAVAQDPVPQVPVPQAFTTAVAELQRGQALTAYERLAALLQATPAPPFALRVNTALAALAAQRGADAAAAIAPVRDSDDAAERAIAVAIAAQAEALRAERAALAAALPDAEPMAWQQAVKAAETAVAGFGAALALRPDWPEVLRNLERAQRRLLEFERQRDAARPPANKEEPAPQPAPPPGKPAGAPEEVAPELDVAPLSAAARDELRQKLAAKERQKRVVRQQPALATTSAERDW